MFKHIRPVWAEINLDNLAHNMREIKKITRAKDIIAVVKADGYGHGAIDTSKILLENGATALAVAVISEAVELRRNGIKCPIMILGYTPTIYGDSLVKYDISPTVFTYEYAKELSDIAKAEDKIIKIQVALDTGMGRIGFMPDKNSVEEVYKISKLPNISIEGIFSHFSTSDEANKKFTLEQLKKYEDFIHNLEERGINIKIRHIANSAAIIDLKDTHFEAVRSGIIMYGYYPSKEVNVSKLLLKPVMTLKTNIIHVKKLPKDYSISYGRTYKTQKEEIIATLPVGYADGYTRQLSDKAQVIINGKLAPVVGRICMDQCMVNVTDIDDVKIGDEVILMGQCDNVKMDADDIAGLLETINYEVVCMIGKRVPRVYIQDNKVIKIRNYV
ncbi:alanine racemase [Clostridium cellulovorans]|uniref:Alanine racemase n=1 Tax=Clostridium cellulovorans (strain ATCC 35296 / DSM 3052 / OCM 3 / 743B) TaxID=573061 RepID=D9SUW5_CLOC7|nr:alanine racemase [Clostridium cellulovorans]ADL51020.1 alanine racemase [Clostridium cellulovorans 743B]